MDFDEETLDPADNVEEYAVLDEKDLQFIVRSVEAASPDWTGRCIPTQPGTVLGDVDGITGDRPQEPQGDPHASKSGMCRRSFVLTM